MTEWEKFERMVSLKSEVVELGMIDEMRKAVKDANKLKDDVSSALSSLNGVDKIAEKARTYFSAAGAEAKQVQKALKELGLPADEEVERIVKSYESNIKQMDEALNAIRKVLSLQ